MTGAALLAPLERYKDLARARAAAPADEPDGTSETRLAEMDDLWEKLSDEERSEAGRFLAELVAARGDGRGPAAAQPLACTRCGVTAAARPGLPFRFDQARLPVCAVCDPEGRA
jgi:hypothetical protein